MLWSMQFCDRGNTVSNKWNDTVKDEPEINGQQRDGRVYSLSFLRVYADEFLRKMKDIFMHSEVKNYFG